MHNRRKRRLIALTLLLAGGALAVACYPREPLLMQRSTRVLDMRASDASEGENYGWLSDHELLYFRLGGNLCRLDTRTGTGTDLPALTRQVKGSIPFPTAHWLVPSPDGKWVLWGQSSNNPLFVASVDGSKRFAWPSYEGSSEPYWLPDSQRWMQWVFGNRAAWTQVDIHSVAHPRQSQTVSALPPGLKGLDVLAVQSEDTIIARTKDVETFRKATPSGAGHIAIEFQITLRDTQDLSIWSLHTAKPLRQFKVHLPGLVQEVKVAPQGDRLAWLVQAQNTSPFLKLMQRFIPAWKEEKRLPMALYVSQLDGSQLHEIGCVDSDPHSTSSFILEMRWLPSGKRLSFFYNNVLWTVPAE